MSVNGCPTDVELIDFQDGRLAPDRRDDISCHLAACAACRERVWASGEIGRLLRAHAPVREDPAGVAAVLSRLGDEGQQPDLVRRASQPWKLRLASMVVVLLRVAMALPPVSTLAGFRLGEAIDFVSRDATEVREYLPGDASPPGTPLAATRPLSARRDDTPFAPVILAELPGNLRLRQQHVSGAILSLRYDDDRGRVIDVIEVLSAETPTTADATRLTMVVVDGVEVGIERDLLGGPFRLLWVRDDVLFELTVVRASSIGPSETDLLAIAGAFLAAPASP